MNKRIKGIIAMVTVALAISQGSANAASQQGFTRISGNTRYETSAAISRNGWTSSKYIVIAQGENFPDALCSVPLAKKYNAPILLTTRDKLSKAVEAEIKRLNPTNVFVIGGEGSVSSKLEKYIKEKFNVSVERLAGKDRYETSTKVAEKLDFKGEVVVASSLYYADALSIAPIAGKKEMPILLTSKNNLSKATKNYLKDKNVKKSYIIGGKGVIGTNVEREVKNPQRVAGKDRFETNIEILKNFNGEIDYKNVVTALGKGPIGNEFADALSGAAYAAKVGAPMVLSYNTLPKVTKNYLESVLKDDSKIYALGGEAVLPSSGVIKVTKPTTGGETPSESGSSSSSGSSSGSGSSSSSKSEGPKVTKLYLKGSDGTLINGEISEKDIRIKFPKGYDKKIVSVIVSSSKDIESVSALLETINRDEMDRVFGSNRNKIDLIKYLRARGHDVEKDGVSISNIRILNETRITLKDANENSTTYKFYIK